MLLLLSLLGLLLLLLSLMLLLGMKSRLLLRLLLGLKLLLCILALRCSTAEVDGTGSQRHFSIFCDDEKRKKTVAVQASRGANGSVRKRGRGRRVD